MSKRTNNGEGWDRNYILTVLGLGVAALSLVAAIGPALVDMGIVDPHRIPGVGQESPKSDETSVALPPPSTNPSKIDQDNGTKGVSELSGSDVLAGGSADLGIGTPATVLPCDDRYIVVLRNNKNPSTYAADVSEALEYFPTSHYVLTRGGCKSLAQISSNHTLLYTVFYGPFSTMDEARDRCQAIEAKFIDPYIRRLAVNGDSTRVNCEGVPLK